MRMTLYGCLLTIALVCHPSVSRGNEQSHRKAAENLLIVTEPLRNIHCQASSRLGTMQRRCPHGPRHG
jgi:hypothetical protein